MVEHLKELQGYFFKEKKGAKKAPYTFRLTQEQVDEILGRAMRLSDRYRIMKNAGASEAEIKRRLIHRKKCLFQLEWRERHCYDSNGFDTLLQILPACRVHVNGSEKRPCKAYVGGPNHHYFKYDMAMVGRRQIGSTMKPYVYSLAMENGFRPATRRAMWNIP